MKNKTEGLISLKDLSEALMVTPEFMRMKIKAGIIKDFCVVSSFGEGQNIYRIKLDAFIKEFPSLKPMIRHYLSGKKEKRFYTVKEFAKKTLLSPPSIRRWINNKSLPSIELPGTSKKKISRIDAKGVVAKYPKYASVFFG